MGEEELRFNTGNKYEKLAHPDSGSAKKASQSGSVYRRLEGDNLPEGRRALGHEMMVKKSTPK